MVRLEEVVREARPGFASGQRDEQGVVQLRMNNVTIGGAFDWTDLTRVPCEKDAVQDFSLRPGDILFNNTNSTAHVGKTATFEGFKEPVVFSNHFTRIRVKGDIYSGQFLALFLNHLWHRGLFAEICDKWIGQSAVKFSKLAAVKIPLAPLADQQRITAQLNAKIAAIEQAKTQSEQQSQELAALVTAGLRDSLVGGSKPFAAEMVLDETSRGVGPRWREFPVIGATRAGWSPAKEPVGKQPERYKLVEPGMVFYNPMRIMIGSIAAVTRPDQIGITSPDYVVVRPKPEFLHPVWFYEWLRSPHHGGQFIAKLARGAVRERMLFTRLGKGIIPVPPLPAQEKFAALCVAARTAQEKIAALQTELEALPNALLREAFNGHS
jgi:type I restriction enzyme S subunit